jgi:uroporphyrinogen decarboxylase
MYTNPKVVECLTEKIVDFYVEANEKFFSELGDGADTFFFGNDFGTQLDLLISVEMWEKFILPGFKRLINVGKKYNKKIMLHSCGAISKVIPTLINAGIDALHPLQALAVGMEPKKLYNEFGNHIAFMGGLDTQDLLVNATPEKIKSVVRELKKDLGRNYIVSPSHECLLPNVPLENVEAMVEAALE